MLRKKLVIVLIIITTGVLLVLAFHRQWTLLPKTPKPQLDSPRRDHRLRIDGLRFFSIQQGRKVLSLEATSFIIEKKRIGFFRLALSQTARMINGKLVIFIEPDVKRQIEQSGLHRQSTVPKSQQVRDPAPLPRLLFDAALKDFPVPLGRIASIEVEPAAVQIMEGEHQLTAITASTAEIRLKNRDIRFAGNVRVTSSKKTLSAGELIFDPEKGILKTEQAYRLTDGNNVASGKRLQMDIFLQSPAASP